METAHGVQVVSVEDDHSYRLNETELEKILMRESIKDLPVVLVSVAGAYRGGKSFLLNFFIRYLSSSPSARADGSWLGDGNGDLTGFTWQGGTMRITTGILMWSEPFVVDLPSGGKVAVLLMDTQGTFDNTSSIRDCSTIFALSSLLSSRQIFNLKANINEDDLHNLQLFTNYGKLMKEESGKAFQILDFLVRDWMNPWEYAYGRVGGEKYLEKKLQTNSSQPVEVRELREQIRASFEKITCFLMPHPGLGVANPKFKGQIKDISQDFTNELKELASSIFSPEMLCIKQIGEKPVNSRELLHYFKSYMTVFNSDKIPTPSSILQATSDVGVLMTSNQIRDQFEVNMQSACGSEAPSMPASEVIELHRRELAIARSTFTAKKLLGDREEINKKLEELIEELNEKVKEFIEINRVKTFKAITNGNEAYDKAIEAVTKGKPLCVNPLDLLQIHNDAVVAALKAFNENRRIGQDGQDSDRDTYSKDLTAKYETLQLTNDQNNKTMVSELKSEYFTYILGQVEHKPNLCESSLEEKHRTAKSKALKNFTERRNQPSLHVTDAYESNLIQGIELQYAEMKQMSYNINLQAFKSALMHFNNISIKARSLTSKSCYHEEALRSAHNDAKREALMFTSPMQVCDDNRTLLLREMEDHYDEMRQINNSANEQLVNRAYWTYRNKFNELSDHWYWAFTSWTKAREYHNHALDSAKDYFYWNRINGRYGYGYDRYMNQMIEKCENYWRSL